MRKRLALKAARVRKGWTQFELSIVLGVSQQTIAKWEVGTNTPKDLRQIRRIAELLGQDMFDLFPDVFKPEEVAAECETSHL